nr:reverse transcriptase domain-containing protein [Tanacetum cinerariifolium]
DILEELEEEKRESDQLNAKHLDPGRGEMVRQRIINQYLPTFVRRLHQSAEYKRSLERAFGLSIGKGFIDGISIGHTNADIQAILKATPKVDPTSSDVFISEYENLFNQRYLYVDKVARMYLFDPSGLQNIMPDETGPTPGGGPQGIRAKLGKTKDIAKMQSPRTWEEMQSLAGKLAALNRYLFRSTEKSLPFFETLKDITKRNYTPLEKMTLALRHVSRRLRRYFEAHPITVITDQPLKQILSKADMSGRVAPYAVELGEHNITYECRNAIKGQVLADFINEIPVGSTPLQSHCKIDQQKDCKEEWTLYTDGEASAKGSDAGKQARLPMDRKGRKCILRSQEDDFRPSDSNNALPKKILFVYLAISGEAASAVLLVVRQGKQHPVHYVSRTLHDAKRNYTPLEKMTLALRHVSRRLRRYFEAHPITVITDQPLKQILSKADMSGRVAPYAVELGEHNITYEHRNVIKGQVLADFINEIPVGSNAIAPLQSHCKIDQQKDCKEEWTLYTDGAASAKGSDAGQLCCLRNSHGGMQHAPKSKIGGIKSNSSGVLLAKDASRCKRSNTQMRLMPDPLFNSKWGMDVLGPLPEAPGKARNKASRVENLGTLGLKWEGPYMIVEAYQNGSYKMRTMDDME